MGCPTKGGCPFRCGLDTASMTLGASMKIVYLLRHEHHARHVGDASRAC